MTKTQYFVTLGSPDIIYSHILKIHDGMVSDYLSHNNTWSEPKPFNYDKWLLSEPFDTLADAIIFLVEECLRQGETDAAEAWLEDL